MVENEIEVKILNIDVKEFELKLKSVGAKLISIEEQVNIRIDSTTHPISNYTDGYLRIRKSKNLITGEEDIVITFKEQSITSGVRKSLEHTSEIGDVDTILDILKLIGYDIIDFGSKKRTSYEYKNNRFDIDIWDEETYPYPYVEVESTSAEKLHEILKELKVSEENISTKSIADLKNSCKK